MRKKAIILVVLIFTCSFGVFAMTEGYNTGRIIYDPNYGYNALTGERFVGAEATTEYNRSAPYTSIVRIEAKMTVDGVTYQNVKSKTNFVSTGKKRLGTDTRGYTIYSFHDIDRGNIGRIYFNDVMVVK